MNNDLVSVIIGTYNRNVLLPRAIKSVLSQTHKNLEVIVVDDASTSDIQEVRDIFNDSRLHFYKLENNRGIAFVSNFGFSKSTGRFIALLGDDDEWIYPQKIEQQLRIIQQNEAIGIVGTWWEDFADDKVTSVHKPTIDGDLTVRLLKGGGVICGSTPLIRRDAWQRIHGFDENLAKGTDSDLFRRIWLDGYRYGMYEEVTTRVHTHHGYQRMTTTDTLESIDRAITVYQYKIHKYSSQFADHPDALSDQYYKLGKLYCKRYRFSRDKGNLLQSGKYLKNSLYKSEVKIKTFLWLLIIRITFLLKR